MSPIRTLLFAALLIFGARGTLSAQSVAPPPPSADMLLDAGWHSFGKPALPALKTPGLIGPSKMSAERLPEMLKKMGYKAEVVPTEIGGPYCLVKLSRDGWEFEIEASVTPKGVIWLTAPLVEIPRDKAAAGKLLNILEANTTVGPCFFTYRAADEKLCMRLEVAGGETGFRGDLNLLASKIRDTYSLWREEVWK